MAAELAAYEARCVAAVAAGDELAAGRLAAARSWRAMLRAAGGDPVIADLLATFVREEAAWAEV